MAVLPCILCGNELDERAAKNGKPYFVCDPCGTQYFVRGKQGIQKLKKLTAALKKKKLAFAEHAEALYEIRAILDELDGLEHELQKHEQGFFAKDTREKKRARALVRQRMNKLLDELSDIAK